MVVDDVDTSMWRPTTIQGDHIMLEASIFRLPINLGLFADYRKMSKLPAWDMVHILATELMRMCRMDCACREYVQVERSLNVRLDLYQRWWKLYCCGHERTGSTAIRFLWIFAVHNLSLHIIKHHCLYPHSLNIFGALSTCACLTMGQRPSG